MTRSVPLAIALVALLTAGGTAQTPPTYAATFSIETGEVYSGTTTFSVDAKGAVTGSMRLTYPATVTAALSGTIKDGTWTFEFAYEMPDQGCSGVVSGKGKVPEDRKVVSGTVSIGGGCVENPMGATFELRRQEGKGGGERDAPWQNLRDGDADSVRSPNARALPAGPPGLSSPHHYAGECQGGGAAAPRRTVGHPASCR